MVAAGENWPSVRRSIEDEPGILIDATRTHRVIVWPSCMKIMQVQAAHTFSFFLLCSLVATASAEPPRTNSIGMVMIRIADELWAGQHEVTQAEYQKVM